MTAVRWIGAGHSSRFEWFHSLLHRHLMLAQDYWSPENLSRESPTAAGGAGVSVMRVLIGSV